IMRSSASTTSLLGSNAPVFVGLGSWMLLGRRPHGVFWAGLAASMAGMFLMVWAGASEATGAVTSVAPGTLADNGLPILRHDVVGDLTAVAAALCFAGYILAVAEARSSMDTLTLYTFAMVACAATLLPICLVIDAPLWGYTSATWMAL